MSNLPVKFYKRVRGFTLIELLVVIAIISILAVTVFVALDPVTRFADSRNSRRWNDVNSILTAVHQYIVDNDGSLPSGISTSEQQLGTAATGGDTNCPSAAIAALDLSSDLSPFLLTIPVDPQGTSALTGYSVVRNSDGIVTVTACLAENSETIRVSR